MLYMETCLQGLLPSPLEPVHFPFYLGPLFQLTMETMLRMVEALDIGAFCLFAHCLLAALVMGLAW